MSPHADRVRRPSGILRIVPALALIGSICAWVPAQAAEKVTYLLPGPEYLPAFVPFQLARAKGYFAKRGVDVTFEVGKGGADVAKQVALGNADLGGGLGDSPIIVRPNGLPVKGVALLGGGGLTQIIVRKDAGIRSLAELKGKTVGVVAYQNTNFYALLPVLGKYGLTRNDVDIQAVGQAGVIQLMIARKLDAISNVPENAPQIEAGGVPVDTYPVDSVFPAMAQAVLASDSIIKKRPAAIRGFVHAVLMALKDIMADPKRSAAEYVAASPSNAGKEAFFEDVLRRYAAQVYRTDKPAELGKFDPARLEVVQKFYLENDIIAKAVPVADLYTNQFID